MPTGLRLQPANPKSYSIVISLFFIYLLNIFTYTIYITIVHGQLHNQSRSLLWTSWSFNHNMYSSDGSKISTTTFRSLHIQTSNLCFMQTHVAKWRSQYRDKWRFKRLHIHQLSFVTETIPVIDEIGDEIFVCWDNLRHHETNVLRWHYEWLLYKHNLQS